jgi:hypothetical protein
MNGDNDPTETDFLGLELNRLFVELESRANKQRLIDVARSLVEAERKQAEHAVRLSPGSSGHH